MFENELDLPKDFLEEEVRNDYIISKEMKQIWTIELDLLYKLQKILNKYNLKYWAIGGTLIGAIRHNGIIPWDDDIDIAMPREDYERLCVVAKKEFQFPYFFQTAYTDKGCVRGHAQLRNSKTTAILFCEKDLFDFNQGIFIDIFPLDNIPNEKEKKKIFFEKINKLRKRSIVQSNRVVRIKGNFHLNILAWKIIDRFSPYMKNYIKFEKLVRLFNDEDCKEWGQISMFSENERFQWDKEWFKETEMHQFEFIDIAIPRDYHKILTKTFGDYMKPVKEPSVHGDVYFDVNKPYEFYTKRR